MRNRKLPGLPALFAVFAMIGGIDGRHGDRLYTASVLTPVFASSSMRTDQTAGYRYIESDGIPDHPTGRFPNAGNPNRISRQNYRFRLTLEPVRSTTATPLRGASFGVATNGVPFDPGTAEWWNNDRAAGWNIEALSGGMNLGLDSNNAHVQPTGAYHYHALPSGLVDPLSYHEGPILIGYAADGFPIYTPFGYREPNDPSSGVTALRSGYRLKSGNRPAGPGGQYDGTYTRDFEYAAGSGELDQCNGREGVTPEFPEGTYYYVITEQFPYVPRCWVGEPDPSFRKSGGLARGDEAQRGGRRGPPEEAISACRGLSQGSSCTFVGRRGEDLSGQCVSPPNLEPLACRPEGHRRRNRSN